MDITMDLRLLSYGKFILYICRRENLLYSAYTIITMSYAYLWEWEYLTSRIYILCQTVCIISLILFVYRIKESEEIISLTVCIYNVIIEDNKLLSVRTLYVWVINIIINIYLVWWLPVTILTVLGILHYMFMDFVYL